MNVAHRVPHHHACICYMKHDHPLLLSSALSSSLIVALYASVVKYVSVDDDDAEFDASHGSNIPVYSAGTGSYPESSFMNLAHERYMDSVSKP